MQNRIQFETPENVTISYEPAGLGSRFLAWFIDEILVGLITVAVIIALLFAGAGSQVFSEAAKRVGQTPPGRPPELPFYALGIAILISNFLAFVYFGASELLMRGQTFGKRRLSLRVVKSGGFSLDAGSVFLRNIFRVIDHIPVLWIVPFVSMRAQRLGDMVAGTVLVRDRPKELGALRSILLQRGPDQIRFRFQPATLQRASPEAVRAVHEVIERLGLVAEERRDPILSRACEALSRTLQVEPPAAADRAQFLQDFLVAEYRRQDRMLG